MFFNPHQAIRHSRGYLISILQGPEMDWRGLPAMGRTTKRKLYLRRSTLFLIEKYIQDARQDEKHVPDLLEAIIQPPGLIKEELRPILFNMNQFRPAITKTWVWPKSQKFPNGFVDHPLPVVEAAHPFSRYLAPLGAKYLENGWKNITMLVLVPLGHVRVDKLQK